MKINKVVCVGDIHGRDAWKEIVKNELKTCDKLVFIGDYFDYRDDIDVSVQIENFKQILELKKTNPDKIVLLIGNHDFHYLKGCGETYSGYQKYAAMDINEVLEPAVSSGLLQICYVYDEFIFSHAGLTQTWCENNDIDLYNIGDSVNIEFNKNLKAFNFQIGDNMSRSGDDVTQSPIWVRIPSLLRDMVKGFTYVIGHSTVKEMYMANNIIAIDCLGTSGEYLVIENEKTLARKILK
jgi:predicted MPP superfamily phosphohydrolase